VSRSRERGEVGEAWQLAIDQAGDPQGRALRPAASCSMPRRSGCGCGYCGETLKLH
jgi:hypothetical protein